MWIVVYGRRYAGKVDHVPGLYFVKTYFRHVYGVPWFPLASFLLWDDPKYPYRGVRIPLCWRSVAKGWLWWYPFWIICLFTLFVIFGPDISHPRPQELLQRRLIGLAIIGLIIGMPVLASRRLAKITTKRAHELAALLSIPAFVLDEHLKGNKMPLQNWLETQPADTFADQTAPRLEPADEPVTGIRELPERGAIQK